MQKIQPQQQQEQQQPSEPNEKNKNKNKNLCIICNSFSKQIKPKKPSFPILCFI